MADLCCWGKLYYRVREGSNRFELAVDTFYIKHHKLLYWEHVSIYSMSFTLHLLRMYRWDATLCPNDVTCATNCALDGADYPGTYGITASGNSNQLKFVTVGPYSTNIGSRTYLMADDTHYQMFNLLGKEFTFDVDVSNLPCGLNGAVYLVSMDADGGVAKYPANKAGAKYGTGYCDSQCPRDLKFINGEVSIPPDTFERFVHV